MRFAFRQLLKNPGFTAVAVLMLALGIGANTAIFSIIHGLLLKPLPYPNPERLVGLWERDPRHGIEREPVSGPDYLDWREQNAMFSNTPADPLTFVGTTLVLLGATLLACWLPARRAARLQPTEALRYE